MYYPSNFYNFMQPSNQPIMVSGIESAKAYATAPNSNVVLFDNNSDIFYLKSTDASNFPQIRTFKFEEIVEPITREEYNNLLQEIEQLKSRQNNEKQANKGGKDNGK